MRKVVIRGPGGHEKLAFEEGPTPAPGPGEVAVATRAIGVNFADVVVRMGLYESAKEYVGWPITPGFECAGTVAALGAGVTDLAVGDDVVALTRFGAYATHVVVPRAFALKKPAALAFSEAGAFFVAHLTAWYALRELANLRRGQRVLVHSAAGGVGSALLQVAKVIGAFSVGVVGAPHKVDVAKRSGADAVIDKSSESLWDAARRHAPAGYHVALDANGVETLKGSYRHLAPTGRLIVYGAHTMLRRGAQRPNWPMLAVQFLRTPRFNPLDLTNDNKSVMAFNLSYLFDEQELFQRSTAELVGWLESGAIQPPPVTEFAFDDVAKAHAALESGASVGRVVLTLPG
jgi:NADPH:quinone reductase-like Zn-dependent oxidoreductase